MVETPLAQRGGGAGPVDAWADVADSGVPRCAVVSADPAADGSPVRMSPRVEVGSDSPFFSHGRGAAAPSSSPATGSTESKATGDEEAATALSSPAPAAVERPAPVTHSTATVTVTTASTQRSSDTARVCLPRWDMGNGSYRWDCSGTYAK
ncbi:hypothetical protein ACFW5I_13815 [Streptomyces sp. NPDC058818]|uniref:hypothetical protein n=1 Tax=Streptomyces sp. NPDC058818 TaxID=3346640 RepID=UPI0036A168DA